VRLAAKARAWRGLDRPRGLASRVQSRRNVGGTEADTNSKENTMIRNTLFGISVLALSAGSAFAAPVTHAVKKTPVVAQADTAAPSGDAAKPAKKSKKSSKKAKGDDASKTEGSKEMKGTAPATK
jgi:hypothetical protein